MKLINSRFTLTIFLLTLMFHLSGFSQSKKQQELEERRRELRQEIQQIGALLFEGKKEQKSVLSVVEDLDFKINVRKNLINITNQQANLLTREINSNQTKISKLRVRLKALKDDYAKMIVKSYKSRADQSKLMFLLSSTNFQQAYKRLQYIKQYAEYQKLQAELIKTETAKMQQLNIELVTQKKNKQTLIEENKMAKSILDQERLQQKSLINDIKKNLSQFTAQLKTKQRESNKIDKEIRKLIDEGYNQATKILTEKIDDLHKIAKALITYETLTGEEIENIINKNLYPKDKVVEKPEENDDQSSALGAMGLKPKIVH